MQKGEPVHESRFAGQSKYKLARDLVGTVFPVSEAVILAAARKYGIGCEVGETIAFTADDARQLYEALPRRGRTGPGRKRSTQGGK